MANPNAVLLGSRLSARAVVGGVFTSYAVLLLFMALGAAAGFWRMRFDELPMLGTGFRVWALMSWVVSVLIGSYVAAMSSRALTARDGMLNGLVTWAIACVIGCAILAVNSGQVLSTVALNVPPRVFFGLFYMGVVACGSGVLGGYLGYRSEVRAAQKIQDQFYDEELSRMPRAV